MGCNCKKNKEPTPAQKEQIRQQAATERRLRREKLMAARSNPPGRK